MIVEEFRNYNDDDYLRWVADHHRGYVLNIQRTCNPILPAFTSPTARRLGTPMQSPVERATGRELCSLARVDVSEVPEN
jgi:hypothetical protein